MTRWILVAAIAAALTAGPAHAAGGDRATLVLDLTPDVFAAVSCHEGALFGFGLDVASVTGRPLGTGQACVDSIDGCEPFEPFCRRTVRSIVTFDLERGSLVVPMKLREVLPTELSFIQAGGGQVREGTGAYAEAGGRVWGGGAGAFDESFAFTGTLVYVAELRGVR